MLSFDFFSLFCGVFIEFDVNCGKIGVFFLVLLNAKLFLAKKSGKEGQISDHLDDQL